MLHTRKRVLNIAFLDGDPRVGHRRRHDPVVGYRNRPSSQSSLQGHRGPILAFTLKTHDGALISVGDDEGAGVGIIAWQVDRQSLKTLACRMANRELSKEEWKEHVGEKPASGKTCDQKTAVAREAQAPHAEGWPRRLWRWFRPVES